MIALRKALIGIALASAIAVAIYQSREVSRLRAELKAVQAEATVEPPLETPAQLAGPATTGTNGAEVAELEGRLRNLQSEVVRLRAQASRVAAERAEADQLRAALGQLSAGAQGSNGQPVWILNSDEGSFLVIHPETNVLGGALNARMSNQQRLRVTQTVERLTQKLGLSAAQAQAMQEWMLKAIEEDKQPKSVGSFADIAAMENAARQREEELRALLSPEQQRAYAELEQGDRLAAARLSAARELSWIQSVLGLSPERQEQVFAALVEQYQSAGIRFLNPLESPVEWFEQRRKPLEAVLSPAEVQAYREALQKRGAKP